MEKLRWLYAGGVNASGRAGWVEMEWENNM